MRVADVGREHVAAMDLRPGTERLLSGRSSLLGAGRFDLLVAPFRVHEFAVVTKADMVAREVIPEETGGRIVDVGLIVLQRKFVGNLTLKIVSALLAAVGDLPGLFVVV